MADGNPTDGTLTGAFALVGAAKVAGDLHRPGGV
jgi:hypothetical protein